MIDLTSSIRRCSVVFDSSAPHRPEAPPTTLLTLPLELLEEILLRIPAVADLACVSIRRIVTDHVFLHRFRASHLLPLLGILSARSSRNQLMLQLAQPPHPSAAAASTLAGFHAADFSCSFLPSAKRWWGRFSCLESARDLAVCDPLYRCYILLPVIPDDLAALAQPPDTLHFEPFLAPPAVQDEGDMSFRVICLVQCTTKLVLIIFSSGSGARQWHAITFDNWINLLTGSANPAPDNDPSRNGGRGCAFYPGSKLLMLDTRGMDFSAVNLPPGTNNTQVAILEAGKGRIGMFINQDMTNEVSYNLLQNDGDGAMFQWLSEAMFNLPENNRYLLLGIAGGYLLLQGLPGDRHSSSLAEKEDPNVFSLNLKTLQLEWFLASKYNNFDADLFAGFPPSLSLPTL
ncbi:hypothetical protein VPH35_019401 [Triticum aestivum]